MGKIHYSKDLQKFFLKGKIGVVYNCTLLLSLPIHEDACFYIFNVN